MNHTSIFLGQSPKAIDIKAKINNWSLVGLVAKSCTTLATSWTVAHQAPLSMGFSREEYWSGLPFPSLGDLPDPGIKPKSPALQADSLSTELWSLIKLKSFCTAKEAKTK